MSAMGRQRHQLVNKTNLWATLKFSTTETRLFSITEWANSPQPTRMGVRLRWWRGSYRCLRKTETRGSNSRNVYIFILHIRHSKLLLPCSPRGMHRTPGCPRTPNQRFGDNYPTVRSKNWDPYFLMTLEKAFKSYYFLIFLTIWNNHSNMGEGCQWPAS